MSAEQRFLSVFFIIVVPILGGLIITAFLIEPLDGPLTRMGGYAERDFGWTGTQLTLGVEDASIHYYRDYSDILVIGDSFSKPGLWQAFLARNTGLSIQTLDLGKTSLPDLLHEPGFIKQPPRIVVVESVEVFFLTKFRQAAAECNNRHLHSKAISPLAIKPKTVKFTEKVRTNTLSFDTLNLVYAWSYLKKALLCRFFEPSKDSVAAFQLTRNDLFSNRLSDELLVFRPDLDKSTWEQQDIDAALCMLSFLQEKFQALEKTIFMFLLVPDKLTAYTPFIKDQAALPKLGLNRQIQQRGIQAPNLIQAITQAIAKGEKDIYLPNETHFGSRGHEIMALALQDYLQQLRALTPPTNP